MDCCHPSKETTGDSRVPDPGGLIAYSEGWGLYAERLAKQMGGYIRGSHDAVLGGGAMPLPVLERRVGEWVDQQREASN